MAPQQPPENLAANLPTSEDPYFWLEEVEGERAISWVKEQDNHSTEILKAKPFFSPFEKELRTIVFAKDRIPTAGYRRGFFYNFWEDQTNIRGIWRRATFDEYQKSNPEWEILIDLDALSKAENENWVWKGSSCLPPDYNRCLISLSRGGKDASVIREFDLKTKSWIKNGFEFAESKSSLDWIDENTVFASADLGPDSLTNSGYPRTVRIWRRGTELNSAQIIYEGNKTDVSVSGFTMRGIDQEIQLINQSLDFYNSDTFIVDIKTRKLTKLPIPPSAHIQSFWGQKSGILLLIDKDWKVGRNAFTAGSLIQVDLKDFLKTQNGHVATEDSLRPELVMKAGERLSIEYAAVSKSRLFVKLLNQVNGEIHELFETSLKRESPISKLLGPGWSARQLPFPKNGEIDIAEPTIYDDLVTYSYADFLTPSTTGFFKSTDSKSELKQLKQAPARFNSSDLMVEQKHALSRDGTDIPYYLVHKKGVSLDSTNPTLLYGYGGFQVSLTPSYSGGMGKLWLERGGVYALANIRGGSEFGPKWHEAGLKENRQKVYDDFIAVAENLIHSKITSKDHLGIMGGSNGGLLMGVMTTQRPDLFGAVVCQVPLLDMLRYHKLLAGASWIGEYGDPDDVATPKIREAILKYSPYQNVKEGVKYPNLLFTTSTKDDRVHPGHARKMAAKLLSLGQPVLYYENTEGGHGGAANLEQTVLMKSLEFTFLADKLGLHL